MIGARGVPTAARALDPEAAGPPALRIARAAVLAIGAALWSWPLTVPLGISAACAGALLGTAVAERVARTHVRLASGLALAAAVALAGTAASQLLVQWSTPGLLLGPVVVLHLGESLFWLSLAAGCVFSLRVTSLRRPGLALLEVLFSGAALVLSLAAHRQGLVHRPLAIGDWAWSRGIDPAGILLLLGAGGTLLLAALLVHERYGKRLWFHFGLLALIGVALMGSVRVLGLPRPQTGSDLGLEGDPQGEAQAANEGDGDEANKPQPDDEQQNDFPFRDNYESNGGQAPVAVVLLHDDYTPPTDVYYFRQSALSQFNGNRLVQSLRNDADRDLMNRFPARRERVPDVPGLDLRRPLRTTVGLLVEHLKPFALDSPESFAPLPNPNSMRFVRVFEAVSLVQITSLQDRLGHAGGSESWSPEVRKLYTEYPDDPRYPELARSLIRKLSPAYQRDPLGAALAIKGYLDEKGVYSLKSRHADATDPAASFLFGDLTGYCVHFAHAAVYLLRSLGVPARVGVGYAVPESDRGQGSSILIRALNAHAWPEVYLEGLGWTVVDLSPEQAMDGMPPPSDQSLQSMLGDMLRMQPDRPDEFLESRRILPTFEELMRAAAFALAGLLSAGLAVKAYRATIPRFAREQTQYRVLYREVLDRLAEIGSHRRFGETREQFAARVAATAPSFGALTTQHLGWALGSRRLAPRAELHSLRARLRTEIRGTVPTWRRWLGIVNPFSWMFAR